MEKKEKEIWKISSIIRKGSRHKEMKLHCQDYVTNYVYRDYRAIALADGAGKSDMAYYGAQTTSKTVVKLLTKNFEEFYQMKKEEIRYHIIVNIREELYKLCKKEGVILDDVKSTLLAAVMDIRDKRCIVVHLGDGYAGIRIGKQCRIISYPKNGINHSLTYLTSTFPVTSKIQVHCGQVEDMNAIFLMSDGWCEKNKTAADIGRIYQQYEKGNLVLNGYTDDIGMIAISQ